MAVDITALRSVPGHHCLRFLVIAGKIINKHKCLSKKMIVIKLL